MNFTPQQEASYNRARISGSDPVSAFEFVMSIGQPSAPQPTSGNRVAEFAKDVGRDIIRPVVTAGQNIALIGRQLQGQSEEEAKAPRYSRILGEEVRPIGVSGNFGQDLRESLGFGLQLSSFLPVGGAVGAGARGVIGRAAAEGAIGAGLNEAGQQLSEGDFDPMAFAQNVLAGGAFAGLFGTAGAGVNAIKRTFRGPSLSDRISSTISPGNASGITQIARETLDRIPRAASRATENIEDAAARAAAISSAPTPQAANALRNSVDTDIVSRITSAERNQAKILNDFAELASNPNRGAKNVLEPLGNEVARAYDSVRGELRRIGSEIGDVANSIPKSGRVDTNSLYGRLDDTLKANGIEPVYGDGGVQLRFGSGFTENDRRAIQGLYEEATRLGDNITPQDVYKLDRVFSRLKRETQIRENLSDIRFNVQQGEETVSRNAFDAFRDIFSQELERISPEIRNLNRQYAPLRTFVDEVDDTIFKAFPDDKSTLANEVTRGEFAPNSIRRAFSNAVSAPEYRATIQALERRARDLGWEGPDLLDTGDLIIRLQQQYFPDTRQITSLGGEIQSIPLTLGGVAERVLNVGRVNQDDTRKALVELIRSLNR